MTKGLFRTNLEIFKYLLSVGLWEYNCEQNRALHLSPIPARSRAQLGRIGEEPFP